MKILVTGAAGYIGWLLIEKLLKEGHSIIGIDSNLSLKDSFNLCPVIWKEIKDVSTEEIGEPEVVIHLAAFIAVGESQKEPEKYWQNNVEQLKVFLRTLKEIQTIKRILFASTAVVYKTEVNKEGGYVETDPIGPISVYGETKVIGEKILTEYCKEEGIDLVILRFFNVVGNSPATKVTENIVPKLKDRVNRGLSFEIYGTDYSTKDGTAIRDYLHIQDVTNGIMASLNVEGYKIYNLGTGRGTSVREIVAEAKKHLGDFPVIEAPRRAGDPVSIIANSDKAQQELNWKPLYDISEFFTK